MRESDLPPGSGEEYEAPERIGDVRVADRAWGMGDFEDSPGEAGYLREFSWTEDNRLREVGSSGESVSFLYDAGGERSSKLGRNGESLYFNSWFSAVEDGIDYRYLKHIYIGLREAGHPGASGEKLQLGFGGWHNILLSSRPSRRCIRCIQPQGRAL